MTTRIKEFRTARGMTQEELANKVGVRRETMVFLEKGKYNPSLRLAFRTAQMLQATLEELFSFADEDWSASARRARSRGISKD
jgi:putative transcriptional regulator